MRALGYFRIDAGTQGLSNGEVEGQAKSLSDFESDFETYCELNLHQPVKTFGDLNAGGDRTYPQYGELIAYIRESGSNFLVAIPDSSHIGCDLETVARAFLEIENAGAKVSCQDEDMPDPLQNALSVLGVSGVSRARSGKIRESMQEQAMWGKGLGRPPFGYRYTDDGSYEIVRDEAPVVELIYRLYTSDRMGMRLIVQHLNERGITTRRGGRWSVVSVRDILKNPVYIGTYTRFGLRLPRSHEPIIDAATYRAARDIVRSRRPRGRVSRAEPYLLSGIAFCDYCGNKMMGVTRHQRWTNKDGNRNRKTYRYYQCQSRNNQSVCGYHTWREADLEGAVLAQIPMAVKAKELDRRDADSGNGEVEEPIREIWQERVRNSERRFLSAMRKTASGGADTDHLADALNDLDEARMGAKRSQNPLDVEDTLRRWEELSFTDKRDFLLTSVAKVEVADHMARVVV